MKDKVLPKSYGEKVPAPVSFPDKDELCKRLDALYQSSGIQLESPPSSFFNGALYVLRYKDNPDWMAQSAHSLREILYQFKGIKKIPNALASYGSLYNKDKVMQDIKNYYGFFSAIAHHEFKIAGKNSVVNGTKNSPVTITVKIFEDIVLRFGEILFSILRRQVGVHQEIDKFFSRKPKA